MNFAKIQGYLCHWPRQSVQTFYQMTKRLCSVNVKLWFFIFWKTFFRQLRSDFVSGRWMVLEVKRNFRLLPPIEGNIDGSCHKFSRLAKTSSDPHIRLSFHFPPLYWVNNWWAIMALQFFTGSIKQHERSKGGFGCNQLVVVEKIVNN